ncbi:hypothetical protein OROGR_008534 [Orobanche gracilis]
MTTAEEEEEVDNVVVGLGSYKGKVRLVSNCEEEIMLLWAIQQPIFVQHNAFVRQSSLELNIDACGRSISIRQSPASLATPGVTGSVMWDSGIVMGKFLEHSVELGEVSLHGKKVVELGSGCGLVGCIAALLGAQVILTDLPDRMKLLKKNVETNLYGDVRGTAMVKQLTWADNLDSDFTDPTPDFVFGSDVVYSEGAAMDLLETLVQLCGKQATVILAGELRNDAILEYFLEAAMKEFVVGRVDEEQWHPDYRSSRVAIHILVK